MLGAGGCKDMSAKGFWRDAQGGAVREAAVRLHKLLEAKGKTFGGVLSAAAGSAR